MDAGTISSSAFGKTDSRTLRIGPNSPVQAQIDLSFKKIIKSLMSLILFHCLHCCLNPPGRRCQVMIEDAHSGTWASERL